MQCQKMVLTNNILYYYNGKMEKFMKKTISMVMLFLIFINSSLFSQNVDEKKAQEIFNRIKNGTQSWWRQNYHIVDEFSPSGRNNAVNEIVKSILIKQIQINLLLFKNKIEDGTLTEHDLQYFDIDLYKHFTYLETYVRTGDTEFRNIVEAYNQVIVLACAFLSQK
jgi:hypothetical protein